MGGRGGGEVDADECHGLCASLGSGPTELGTRSTTGNVLGWSSVFSGGSDAESVGLTLTSAPMSFWTRGSCESNDCGG